MNDAHPAVLKSPPRASTGITGLDDVLRGGLLANRVYLVEGAPGAGKTTLALQFLLEGRHLGEAGLYVTLSESEEELRAVAASHHWSLDGIDLFEFASAERALSLDQEQTLLHPWEVELGETMKAILDKVKVVQPKRVVFDSLSEMRLLAQDPLRYRRQILALKQYFTGQDCTVLLLDDLTGGPTDLQLHSICHGVIALERLTMEFGAARRRIEVQKMRGSAFLEGWHDYVIRPGGLDVFPRLVAAHHHRDFLTEQIESGVPELDALLDGGPLRGTSTLVLGPAGIGKTSIALQYMLAAAHRGERSAIYEFDERAGTLITRSKKLGIDIEPQIRAGLVSLRQLDPAELAPGEFAWIVRQDVERVGARVIVIDSLTGYMAAMPEEKQLLLQVHELLSYLSQVGVATFLISPQLGLVGNMQSTLNISYIADAVLLLRFFESGGRIRKAVSVIKNRGGAHEDTIREFTMGASGIKVGAPLTEFEGVLTGVPRYVGGAGGLMRGQAAEPQT
ncbi:MAG: ATPase domain-containing protein [Microvirga sp.]